MYFWPSESLGPRIEIVVAKWVFQMCSKDFKTQLVCHMFHIVNGIMITSTRPQY